MRNDVNFGMDADDMKTRIIFSEKCLAYGSWHTEGPERVHKAQNILKEKGYSFVTPEPATEDDLLKVHDHEYLWLLKKGMIEDDDTPAYDNIFELAKLSAGGAILAAKMKAFSLMRPPGHHAGASGAALGAATRGFCYLNNVAIAVRYLGKPTLILDIDGHHGNGTQEIFYGDSVVTYVSLHRHPNFPGTGNVSDANCLNFPLPPDCGDTVYLKTLDKALGTVETRKFEIMAVSAGFDTYAGDLASLGLSEKAYRGIGKRVAALQKPTFFVLEGGYSGQHVGKAIDELLRAYEDVR